VRIAYFDTFSGISGDMTVGALLDLGVPLGTIEAAVQAVGLRGVTLASERVERCGIAATKFHVHGADDHDSGHHHHHPHRPYAEVRDLVAGSGLEPGVRDQALAVFARLAEAEGAAHGVPPDSVEFHEVGAVDAIVDVVGAVAGLHHLGVERAWVAPLPLGQGMIHAAHGPLPVPGPAVVSLLAGRAVRFEDGGAELVTPTGAALVAALTDAGTVPPLRIEAVGHGAGTRELPDRPNLLRLVLGTPVVETGSDDVIVLEATIDDMNPEFYEHVLERLLAAGAKDAFLTPVVMKKSRPGVTLSVLVAPADRDRLAAIVFAETSTIGLRWTPWTRVVLPRESRRVETAYGAVSVKLATAPDGTVNVAPELDDCRRVAAERGVPLKLVHQAAVAAAVRGG
jgi:uncharacterized protein (TIGR00299 family) protein